MANSVVISGQYIQTDYQKMIWVGRSTHQNNVSEADNGCTVVDSNFFITYSNSLETHKVDCILLMCADIRRHVLARIKGSAAF